MTVVASDSFTGTAGTLLTAHTSDSGHAWLLHPSSTLSPVLSNFGSVRKGATTATQAVYLDVAMPSADQRVSARVIVKSTASNFVGVCARMDATATTFYHLRSNQASGLIELHKFVAGTATLLDSFGQVFVDENDYDFVLEVIADRIRGYVDGVLKVEATDASIPDAGFAGIRLSGSLAGSDTTQHHLDDFVAESLDLGDGVRLSLDAVQQTQLGPETIYDATGNRTIAGAISSAGDLLAIVYDHDTDLVSRSVIGSEAADTHNVPTIRAIPGRRPLAVWTGHNVDADVRLKIGTVDDIASLVSATPATITFSGNVSYNFIFHNDALSDGTQDTYWFFTRVDTAGWYACQFSVDHSTGAVTQDWIRAFMTGDFIYLSSAEATDGSGDQIIRLTTFWNPSVSENTSHYLEINMVTGTVTSAAETLTANLVTNTGLPLDGDTLAPVLAQGAAGIARPVFGVRGGPDDPQILYAEVDDAFPDDAIYYVYDLATDTSISLGPAGKPLAVIVAGGVVRLHGMVFPSPSNAGAIIRATGDGTTEQVDWLTPDGSGGYDATTLLTQPTAWGKLVQPSAPYGGGPFGTLVANMTLYDNYDDFNGDLLAIPAPAAPETPLAGSAAATSTASLDHLTVAHALAGAGSAVSAAVLAGITVSHSLAGSSAASAAGVLDHLQVSHPLGGASAAVSAGIASLSVAGEETPLAGAGQSVSAATLAGLSVSHAIAGQSVAASQSTLARLSLAHALAGQSAALSDAALTRLIIAHVLAGSAATTSDATGMLSVGELAVTFAGTVILIPWAGGAVTLAT